MSSRTKIGYGCGHVFNDMFLATWFTYMLLFLVNVVQMSSVNAGVILFIGQISDGISSVLMGFILDTRIGCKLYNSYGIRKVICYLCNIEFENIYNHAVKI